MHFDITPHTLHYKRHATTSRGAYSLHRMLIIRLWDDEGRTGVGECAPLPDLGIDSHAYDDIEVVKTLVGKALESAQPEDVLREFPALLFALESALAEMARPASLYATPFALGQEGIPINGLIWMAPYQDMLQQIEQKLQAGFHCLKLKIGAIDWADEIALIRHIRNSFDSTRLQLRVDANGAFSAEDAPERLRELADYDIHSIEQPIRQGQWTAMKHLCATSPLPIAFDEELIGITTIEEKRRLLQELRPQFIVLKPTLHGGYSGVSQWHKLAQQQGIGSWITSALESNIGLRHVALLAASLYGPQVEFPQGLGTGQLFTDNIPSSITIRGEKLWNLQNL